jgi:hypothetical protein
MQLHRIADSVKVMLTGIMPMALEQLIRMPIEHNHSVGLRESFKGMSIVDDMNGCWLIPEHEVMVFPLVFRCHYIDRRLPLALFTHEVGIMLPGSLR